MRTGTRRRGWRGRRRGRMGCRPGGGWNGGQRRWTESCGDPKPGRPHSRPPFFCTDARVCPARSFFSPWLSSPPSRHFSCPFAPIPGAVLPVARKGRGPGPRGQLCVTTDSHTEQARLSLCTRDQVPTADTALTPTPTQRLLGSSPPHAGSGNRRVDGATGRTRTGCP